MQLKTIVPWGRNLSEYKAMFNLSDSEIKTAGILGCGDGALRLLMQRSQHREVG